jgi:alkylation response protein AidB-like acyl-CoA dehydrogenase
VPQTRSILEQVKHWASLKRVNDSLLIEERGFRQRVAQLEIDLFALEFAVLRVLHAPQGTEGLASVLKVRGAELTQRANELAVEVLGPRGLALNADEVDADPELPEMKRCAAHVAGDYLFSLSASIAGGTSEIQRNIIAGLALGL